MVEDEDVQPRVLARVVVAAGAPVLPLPHLEARVTCHKLSRVTSCEVTWTQLRSSHMVSVWSKHLLPSPYDSSAKLRSSPVITAHIIYIYCLIGASFCILQRRQQRHVGHDTAAYDGRRCAVITCNFPAPQYLCSHNVETFHSGRVTTR